MGYMKHEAVIVTTFYKEADLSDMPDVEAFRQSLPEDFQTLVVGPIKAPTNSYVSYVFLPDGSKEGWDTSDAGDEYREQFKALFDERYAGGFPRHEWIHVSYGSSHRSEYGVTADGAGASVVAQDSSDD